MNTLTARDMEGLSLAETVARMDAGVEPTGMYLRRVSDKDRPFISRIRKP